MKAVLVLVLPWLLFGADTHESCMEKLERLEALKSQKASVAEKVASCFLNGYLVCVGKSRDEKLLEENIRILELELKTCR